MNLETYPTAAEAAAAAALAILGRLSSPGPRRLLVTGGSGPGPVYDRLADIDLDWSRVTVTLSDDRFVGLDSPDSNERMVRERLLTGHAAAATFLPLRGAGATPDQDATAAEPRIASLLPFDVALLGMGPDGHIASLYAGDPAIVERLDPDGERLVVGVEVAGWQPYVPRISLTGRALFDSRLILLLIGGAAKRKLLEQAVEDPSLAPPVAALLNQTRAPVRVLWSPEGAA